MFAHATTVFAHLAFEPLHQVSDGTGILGRPVCAKGSATFWLTCVSKLAFFTADDQFGHHEVNAMTEQANCRILITILLLHMTRTKPPLCLAETLGAAIT